jgi:U3 small nucleolar RNA-associated protein 6
LLAELRTALPDEPLALKLSATRALSSEVDGEDLVDVLKNANERFLSAVRQYHGKNKEGFFRAYAEFVEEWCRLGIDDNLVGRYIRMPHYIQLNARGS